MTAGDQPTDPHLRPVAETRRVSTPWVLMATSFGAALVAVVLVSVFAGLGGELAQPAGLPCDRSVSATSGPCVLFEERSPFREAEVTELGADELPFVRIEQPNDLVEVWASAASFAVVLAAAAAMLSLWWRRELERFAPSGTTVFGVKSPVNLVVALVPACLAAVYGGGALVDGDVVEGIVLIVLWLCATPALVALFDCALVAFEGAGASALDSAQTDGSGSVRERELVALQSLHEKFIGLLGGLLATFVLWLAIDAQLRSAVLVSEVARQNGSYLVEPAETGRVFFWGILLTALLVIGFVPTHLRIRSESAALVEEASAELDWETDFAEAQKQRDARLRALGLDQPLHTRFQNAVAIGAPLLTSVGSSFVSF